VAVERQDEAAFVVEIDADLLVERLREHDHDEVVVMLSEEEKYLTTANGLAELSRRIAHPADR